ncbi:uncharacterized protein VTP21DRAFT_1663 [Calcarisporiella thermophila]|uniref:uncharacterized protein n=1 Tax=Calcarisporiella thermophila TaxID=911321 RepID=UPI0037420239
MAKKKQKVTDQSRRPKPEDSEESDFEVVPNTPLRSKMQQDEDSSDDDIDLFESFAAAGEHSMDGMGLGDPAMSDGSDHDDEERFIAKQNQALNRKKKKSGGFQSMGLSHPVFKAIIHKGFKVPTPIQRKCIPSILEGRDVVGMARTGSGKTAAFVIPLIEKLKTHSAKVGARGIILSPSRELALQTAKVVKDISKFTDLRSSLVVGGDNMEDQFNMMAGNPDILIATPGRLLHLIVEMDLDLRSVEYIVFDEADRLFEMGFAVQLHEILHRLPPSRQTLLFSATLPKLLVDFAKAGLQDPLLERLDADTKISKDLEMAFFYLKQEEKEAGLVYLLREVIQLPKQPEPKKDSAGQTIVFVSTKHHVEYLSTLLAKAGYQVSYIYGTLDQTARKIQINKFRQGRTNIMVVTDVAARGIDIPILENVINYDFVESSKIFVHRVGRTARAGRRGWAYSFATAEELPYLLDLQLFLGRKLALGRQSTNYVEDVVVGGFPRGALEMDVEWTRRVVEEDSNLEALRKTAQNGYRLYCKSRPSAAAESYKRAKEVMDVEEFRDTHPLLAVDSSDKDAIARENLINSISNFRPQETIFEVGSRGNKASVAAQVMKTRREHVGGLIEAKHKSHKGDSKADAAAPDSGELEAADESDIKEIFSEAKKRKREAPSEPAKKKKKMKRESFKDEEYYMSHYQADANTERGYSMTQGGSFAEQANKAVLDLQADDQDTLKAKQNALRWDKKKKKFVRGGGVGSDNKRLITTESGVKLAATYKSGKYKEWLQKRKISMPRTGEEELPSAAAMAQSAQQKRRFKHHKVVAPKALDPLAKDYERKLKRRAKETPGEAKPQATGGAARAKSELKSVDQIRRQRLVKQRRKEKNARPSRKPRK